MTPTYIDTAKQDSTDEYYKELQSGDQFVVASTGSVAMTGTFPASVLAMAGGSSATIGGSLYGYPAIVCDPDTAITVTKTGSLLSTGGQAIDTGYVGVVNAGITLNNAGSIVGHNGAFGLYAYDQTVINSGEIAVDAASTTGYAVSIGCSYEDGGSNIIQNSGTIESASGSGAVVVNQAFLSTTTFTNSGSVLALSGYAYYGGRGVDQVYNDGAMTGTVHLNDGDDLFDGSGGTFHGILYGDAGNDTLIGSSHVASILDGGAGADTLTGNSGHDDAAYIDALSGVTADLANSALNTGDAAGDTYYRIDGLIGSPFNDTLIGNDDANVLNGLGGVDTMVGGLGDDIYVVGNAADVIVENPNEGTDLVESTVSYVLPANVERLTLEGTAAINATGNDLANILIGNSAANTLNGMGGADYMAGGAGNDIYYVDNPGDVINETGPSTDVDLVYASVSWRLGPNLERLTLLGTANINATGNELANLITGNSGNNIIDGKAGADYMAGGLGDDTYYVDNIGDTVVEAANAGNDTVHSTINYTLPVNVENLTLDGTASLYGNGNALANVLTGNSGNNGLDGKAGADTMIGGAGDDTYYVDNVGDVVVENANEGTDLVHATVSYTLPANVERLTLDGTAAIAGTGNDLSNIITGNTASNVLTGGKGSDYFVYTSAVFGQDQITDFTAGSAAGHDIVQISHNLFADYNAILAASTQVGDSTVITYDANDTITLDHVAKSALVAADFVIV